MLTRMPPWHGRAATLRDGRRVGAMRLRDAFAFHVPDLYDDKGVCIGHGGNVAGPKGAHVVCDAGQFFAVGWVETVDGRTVLRDLDAVTYDAEALAALASTPEAQAALAAHLAANPVDADDLVGGD